MNLDGGTPNLNGGTLTLVGGTRPPYNLSADSLSEHFYKKLLREKFSTVAGIYLGNYCGGCEIRALVHFPVRALAFLVQRRLPDFPKTQRRNWKKREADNL